MRRIEDIIKFTAMTKMFFNMGEPLEIEVSESDVMAVLKLTERDLKMKAKFLDADAIVFVKGNKIKHVTSRFIIESYLRWNTDLVSVSEELCRSMRFAQKKINIPFRP